MSQLIILNDEAHMKKIMMTTLIILLSQISTTCANELISEAPANAEVYFISPIEGQNVKNPFKVSFGLRNMGVAPAGVHRENTGHHHILIDTDINTIDLTNPLPATDKIIHFGGGQTEAELTLSPGQHILQLLLGNFVHIPHKKAVVSQKITVIVE